VSVKIIACLNPTNNDRKILEVNPGSIKEIIQNLNSGFPLTQARVCRNGEIIKDFDLIANDGDMISIKFVPYGDSPQQTGALMKGGGWAMMGLGALAFLIPGIGGFLGSALVGTGLAMVLGGTVLLNVNIPSLKDREKPENDPSIRGGKNQARPHGRIPVLFGRHRIYPDLAANPHTEIIGNQQYFTQLFCGGYKDYVIDLGSIKLGDTPIIDFSRTKNIQQILSGADPVIKMEILQNGETSNLYPYCVNETVINAPLQNQIDDGDGNMIPGEIIRTTPNNTDRINIDIFFHNGLGKYNDNGDLVSSSVTVRAQYKPAEALDSAYQSLGFFNGSTNAISGSELKTKRYQLTRSGLTPGQYTIKIERVTADSTDSKVIDLVYIGSIRSIKSIKSSRPIRAERQKDLTIIALRVMATSKLNGVIDGFNYVAESKLPVYSSGGTGQLYWLNVAQTRNPASMLLYALRGRAAQQSVDSNDINWQSIEDFYTWCQEHEYTCNAYLSESVTIAELIRMIGNTSRADILRIDSKISVVQDIERSAHMQLFTPKNSISYSITMFNADVPDAIALRYIDEESGFTQNELLVYNTPDGNRIKEPDSTQKADIWGITNSIQARRIGMYNYACIKNRPFVHSIEVDIEYLIVNKGDWIQYAGDIALTGSVQGRIKGIIIVDGVCIGIDTDEPVIMTEGQQHAVRIRLSNGTIILKEVVYSPGIRREKSITYYPTDEDEDLHEPFISEMYAVDEDNEYYEPQNIIIFIEPMELKNAPKAGDIYAFGIRGYEVIDLIITDVQPGQNLTAVLTCVEYSPEIFGVDKPDFILPDFVNGITPVSGAVDHGVVNSNNWRNFAVYHDREEEPSRPSGDGQDSGWHHVQTFRSVWQSTKIAESIESGEWGLPVRIKAQRGTDDITPIWLSLTPQSITLDTDGDGKILAGLLPATVQARLFQWNSILSNVTYSLVNAPSGISINSGGLITIGTNAELADVNKITVRAVYQSGVYNSTLSIYKNVNNYAPRYLGTVQELTVSNATVNIIKGPVQDQVQARQGDYVLAIAALNSRSAGSVFQWSGVAWEFRSPETHADLYMRCFKDGLDVPALTHDMGWFGAVFAKLIVAQQAFIEELSAQVITLQHDGIIKSSIFQTGVSGFQLKSNGDAEFNNITARGHIEAESGFIKNVNIDNVTIGESAIFLGNISSGPVFISNETTAPVAPQTFNSNTPIRDIINTLGRNVTINTSSGSYGSKGGLVTIITNHWYQFYPAPTLSRDHYNLTLVFNDNSSQEFIDIIPIGSNPNTRITQQLSIGGSVPGKIFRINNLPTGSAGLPAGTVYKNGNQLMIV